MKKKAAKRKSKRKAAKESSCVFATRQAWGPLPYPHLTAACALSVLSTAGEWAGEKLMLLREVQASLSPENPAGGWMQRWHKPSAGYGPRLEAETAPPSFLPSLPARVPLRLPHTWKCLWKPPGERLCCGGGCRGAPAGDAPPYGAGYRGLTVCGLRGVCAPGEGLPKRP